MANRSSRKIPPHNEEAEQAVLGAVLLDNQALPRIIELIREDDFYSERHRVIYRTILHLFDTGSPVDLVTLAAELKKNGLLEKAGDSIYLANLLEEVPAASNVEHYAGIVTDKALLRRLINASTENIDEALADKRSANEVLDTAEKRILDIRDRSSFTSYVQLGKLVSPTVDEIEKLYDREGVISGVPTGLTSLDELTLGLQPSNLVILAARPSVGKTSLALTIAGYTAVQQSRVVAFFSLEMAKEELATRLLCSQAKVNAWEVRRGRLPKNKFPLLVDAAAALYEAPILIDDSTPVTPLELRAKARRIKSEVGRLDLIVVDYLQLMKGTIRTENRQQEISEISRGLKELAKEMKVPVLALSQLSRKVEERQGGRPQLADLRESGAIEQDADVVVFIHRPPMQDSESNTRSGVYELIIGKQRNGPTGTIKVVFNAEQTRFDNYSPRDEIDY
ncbi:MAG: replicative DNA helicase [Deltaproteobacteria bacterium]|nr:replicative DNA helicase [Deltaproteobacteria bacterium]